MLLKHNFLCDKVSCLVYPLLKVSEKYVMGIRLGPVIFNLRQQLLWQRVMVVFLTAHGGVSDTDATLPVAAGWVLLLLAIVPLQLSVAVPGVPLSGLHMLAPEVVV